MSNPPTETTPVAPSSTNPPPTPNSKSTKFATKEIPPFKPFNYAAAAAKAQPSLPAVTNNAIATGITSAGTPSSGTLPIPTRATGNVFTQAQAHPRQQSVKVEAGVNVPIGRVNALQTAAADANKVAFGNLNDKNAILSSSPAAPPSFNSNPPEAFGTVPAAPIPTATKAKLNLHSFFAGGGSPSLAPATIPSSTEPRRSAATFDPSSSRSPQLTPSPGPPNQGQGHSGSQLSSHSQTFAPLRHAPPSFIPGQPQGLSFSPASAQFGHHGIPPSSPYNPQQQQHQPQQGQQPGSPYLSHKPSPAPQNIPNGSQQQYGGPGVNSNGGGPQQQRSGSFVGSPVMQGQRPPQSAQRAQFGGPTSPRLPNSGLPPSNMMAYQQQGQQQWQPQANYGGQQYPPPAFYPSPSPYAPQSNPYQPQPPLVSSGGSTPSTSAGVRTPSISGPIPPIPSPSLGFQPPSSPSPVPSYYGSSPQPQSATLPHHSAHPLAQHPQPGHAYHPSLSAGIPIRAPPQSNLSNLVNASEFRPLGAASIPEFVPSPRKSAAIKIVNPKNLAPKELASTTPAVVEKKVDPSEEEEKKKKAAAEEAEKVKLAEREKAKKAAADEAAKAAELAKVEEARIAKEAEEKKVAEEVAEKARLEKERADKEIAEAKLRQEQEEAAKQKAALAAAAAAATPTSTLPTSLPSSLPAKPVMNGGVDSDDKPKRSVPDSLDLSATKSAIVVAPLPSALLTARVINNLDAITYPSDIKSPRPDLNVASQPGKYRYDREFLMQFMAVCMEKPENLPNLEAIGMMDGGSDNRAPGGGFNGGRRSSSQMGPPAPPARGGSTGPGGFSRGAGGGGGAFGGMGNFGQAPLGSSEQRFQASLGAGGPPAGGRSASGQFGGSRTAGPMSRSGSQSGTVSSGGNFAPSHPNQRIRSVRGQPRAESGRGGGSGGGGRDGERGGKNGHVTGQGFEDAPALVPTADRWTPSVSGAGLASGASTPDSPEMVQRKVKALLNKLTLERFDSISNQILEWANKSVNESDGRILRQVIALIFEKATDEANWSEMYARLCRFLMEKVSTDVKDESVVAQGAPVAGGALFRKYLLNRCQEDYESGWKAKETATAAAAGKAADDNAKKEANDAAKKEEEEKAGGEGASKEASSSSAPKEAELLSDEYYAAQKAKRRGLGLVRFIGELFRLSMLTERIMHECIKKLLANLEDPEEEDVESLCRLLTTVGKLLDVAKAKGHMDIYFTRMKQIADNMKISSRIRFMIQDVLELRGGRWQPRHDAAGPKTISEIHSDAQRASEEASRRTASSGGKGMPAMRDQLSRPNSRRGQGRDQFGPSAPGVDGWSAPVPQRPAKAGDLGNFGQFSQKTTIPSLGPSGAFANRAAAKLKEAARAPAPSNPFSALDSHSEPSSSGRPKLVLAPRTKPIEGADGKVPETEEAAPAEHEEEEEEEEDDGQIDPNAVSMSRAEGERRADNSVKEFFSVRSLSEGVASVEALPADYRGYLISSLAEAAVNKKADDVNLCRALFAEILVKKAVTHAYMMANLTPLAKLLVDLVVDVPALYTFTAQLLAGAGATKEEVEAFSLLLESEDEEPDMVEKGRSAVIAAFEKLQA